MNKAIFLDRDGVINKERGDYTYKVEDFEINPGLFELLEFAKREGYLTIVITNQGGIAKGLYTLADFSVLCDHLAEKLKEKGLEIDDVFVCPHHPDFGKCECRKPNSLLLEKAIAKYNINPAESWFIGDNERDVTAGLAVGIKSIKITSNIHLGEVISQLK